MAFTYSTTIQDRIALTVFGVSYSSLSADQKKHTDGTWTTGSLTSGAAFDALTRITQIANWFEQAGATSAPQAWEHWLVAETACILGTTYRPDRQQFFIDQREKAIDTALDSFTLRDPTGAFASGNLSQAKTVNGIRFYVLNHCARRKESGANTGLRRRIFPPIDEIDSHIQWTLNHIYNVYPWNFRKRAVKIKIDYYGSFTNGTWTQSTKLIDSSGFFNGFPSSLSANQSATILVTGGTNVITGVYPISAPNDSDSVTLRSSLSATGGDLATGDISAKVCIVTLFGLGTDETFDSFATRRLHYVTNQYSTSLLEWVDATVMSQMQAYYGTGTGIPSHFRTEILPSDSLYWHFAPFPSADLQLSGAVYVRGPGTPSSETSTTIFDKFPSEFFTVIRDMVLARVLLQYGASDAERVWTRCVDQVASFLPTYTDQGAPTRQTSIEDVYNDGKNMIGSTYMGSGRFGMFGGLT